MNWTPKVKRNFFRIIPFSVIWFICGWIAIIIEIGVTRNQNLNPETDITYTFPVLVFASLANVIIGFLVGVIEVFYYERRFSNFTILSKIFYKLLTYLSLFLIILIAFYPIALALEKGVSHSEADTWVKLGKFLTSISFLVTLFQLAFSLTSSLIYSAISEHLGHHAVINLVTGKYHKPVVEERIFMFLDMKKSTSIAESLGHLKYFALLQEYYDLMSDPIVMSYGEVYQYIGDEIVVSWIPEKGLMNANCINCYFAIKKIIESKKAHFISEYGFDLGFRAGLHFGEVTIGVVGALKKEIVFTGDILNTTSRIQNHTKEVNTDLLVSKALMKHLSSTQYHFESIGEIKLKGKNTIEELYTITPGVLQEFKEQ